MSREEDIQHMLETDRLWPPITTGGHPNRRRFVQALVKVLKLLPDEAFDHVYELDFVVDDGFALAFNVPGWGREGDQIVLFRAAFQLSDDGLVGLIAHELAHSFVAKDNHRDNEEAADDLVRQWGLGDYLELSKRQ